VGGRSNTLNPLNPLAPDERGVGWMRRLPTKSHLKFQHSELPVTLSYVKQRCMIAGEDWAIAEDILKPDPNESPTVPELLNRFWLAQY